MEKHQPQETYKTKDHLTRRNIQYMMTGYKITRNKPGFTENSTGSQEDTRHSSKIQKPSIENSNQRKRSVTKKYLIALLHNI